MAVIREVQRSIDSQTVKALEKKKKPTHAHIHTNIESVLFPKTDKMSFSSPQLGAHTLFFFVI